MEVSKSWKSLLLHQFWILIDMFYPNVEGRLPPSPPSSAAYDCRERRGADSAWPSRSTTIFAEKHLLIFWKLVMHCKKVKKDTFSPIIWSRNVGCLFRFKLLQFLLVTVCIHNYRNFRIKSNFCRNQPAFLESRKY